MFPNYQEGRTLNRMSNSCVLHNPHLIKKQTLSECHMGYMGGQREKWKVPEKDMIQLRQYVSAKYGLESANRIGNFVYTFQWVKFHGIQLFARRYAYRRISAVGHVFEIVNSKTGLTQLTEFYGHVHRIIALPCGDKVKCLLWVQWCKYNEGKMSDCSTITTVNENDMYAFGNDNALALDDVEHVVLLVRSGNIRPC